MKEVYLWCKAIACTPSVSLRYIALEISFLCQKQKNKSCDGRDQDADSYIVDELKCSPVNPEAPPTEF